MAVIDQFPRGETTAMIRGFDMKPCEIKNCQSKQTQV